MPRTILHNWIRRLACGAIVLTATARANEPSPRVPPTVALAAHHPISRTPASVRDGVREPSSTSSFWLSSAGIVVAIAAFGAFSLGAKKLRPGADSGPFSLKVVGRTSLSPKHTVYLLKVGNRVLIVGAGGQGPPSLLGELNEADAAIGGTS